MDNESVTLESVIALLQNLEQRVAQRQVLLGELGVCPDTFNLFKVISDKYRKENLHSDILAYLLDKAPGFLNLFLEQVDKLECLKGKPEVKLQTAFYTNHKIEIIREKGRIDILIQNATQAIIIENKLNGAPDMDTQLCRYYHYAIARGKKVLAIIYIPLNKDKKPPINTYECDTCATYKECLGYNNFNFEKLGSLTRTLPIKPLVEILTQWEKEAEQEDMKMFVRHYENLLRELGANSMTKQNDISIIEDIFSDKTSLQTARALSNIWQRKNECLRELVSDKLSDILTQSGYIKAEDIFWEKKGNFLVKNLPNNGYFKRIIYKPKWLTFALEPIDKEKGKIVADGILEQCDDCYLTKAHEPEGNAFFRHRNFYFDDPTETLDEIVNKCAQCFSKLATLAQEYSEK